MRTIYLDYNATTPVAPAVRDCMLPFLEEHYGNPSSGHALGRACHEAVEDARSRVAFLLGADRAEIVFTSGGSEANNLAIKGVALRHGPAAAGHVVISALEHPATVEPARFLERLGYGLTVVGCDRRGVVDPEEVARALRPDTVLVSVMHANNEIGTVQPIRAIADVCRPRGVLLHTDAAQSAGKLPIGVAALGVDLLSLAGHKFYAPKGVGALYVRRGVELEPLIHGAGHEAGLRAGTENVASIVGLGIAAAQAAKNQGPMADRMTALRDRLHDRLGEAVGDVCVQSFYRKLLDENGATDEEKEHIERKAKSGVSVNGDGAERLPNTLSINFHGAEGHELLRRCPELCASTGAACHSGATKLSATAAAIGLPPEIARGTVRLSLGWYTTEEEVDRAASLLIAAWETLR